MQRRMRLTATQSFRFDELRMARYGRAGEFQAVVEELVPDTPWQTKRSPEAVRQMQLRRRKPRVRTEYWR